MKLSLVVLLLLVACLAGEDVQGRLRRKFPTPWPRLPNVGPNIVQAPPRPKVCNVGYRKDGNGLCRKLY